MRPSAEKKLNKLTSVLKTELYLIIQHIHNNYTFTIFKQNLKLNTCQTKRGNINACANFAFVVSFFRRKKELNVNIIN